MLRSSALRAAPIVLLLLPDVALAAGWTQPQDGFYLKLWNRSLVGRNAFLQDGDTAELPDTYQDHQLNLYGEYGLTERLTLTLSAVPFGFSGYDAQSKAYFGGGSLGARYQLYRGGGWAAAVAVDVGGRPSSGDPLFEGPAGGQAVRIEPIVGSVYGGGTLEAGYGLSFGWLSTQVGGRFFSNGDLEPAIFGGVQFGWNIGAGFVFDIQVAGYSAFGDLAPVNVLGGGQTRYVGVDLGLAWWFLDGMAVHVGFGGAPFAEANAATPSIKVGFEFR